MTSPVRQLAALLALRWQMARTVGVRSAVVLGALVLGWLVHLLVGTAELLDAPALATVLEIAPGAFLGFGVLALVAPLVAGGGMEVVPPDQLVAYPVRSRTLFYGGLLLAPANLVWIVQLLALAALTAYLTVGGRLLFGAVTTAVYVLSLTVLGQALAWLVVGLRQSRAGRRVVAAASAGLVVVAVLVVRGGHVAGLMEAAPTRHVVGAVIAGGEGRLAPWAGMTAVLLLTLVAGLVLGGRLCGWALRRPAFAAAGRTAVRRRRPHRTALGDLLAVDRASVWRAPPLRRGGLVLAVLPGVVAAGAAVPWESLVILPGLVAAGTGLLFGVNLFCLDGSGAVWVASLPHSPRLAVWSKTVVLTETVLGAALLAVLAGSLRAPGSPTAAELTAILTSAVTCTAVVVSVALAASVRRPHRADLVGPRDAVAPPGALAWASVRMATPTAVVGVLVATTTQLGDWWWPLLVAVPVLTICGLSVARSIRRYADPVIRAHIARAVSAG